MSIIAEAPGYIKVFSDGSVKRFAPEIVAASLESSKGYKSKDVVIDPSKPITGRLFCPDPMPSNPSRGLLPVVVYFHGGGFCIGSTTWFGYHLFLGDLAAEAQVIVLSIDYRLAPENRLPVAYSDCYASLTWLSNEDNSEPWLERADISRVFLSGDSAGGNIAHNVAIQVIKSKPEWRLKITGLLLIHPYFGSEKRTHSEKANEESEEVKMNDMFWKLSIPKESNRDYFGCNFELNELSTEEWPNFHRVAVYVAELDFLMERGVMYAKFLTNKGSEKVELIEAKGEKHVYHVFHPHSKATHLLQKQMSKFINSF